MRVPIFSFFHAGWKKPNFWDLTAFLFLLALLYGLAHLTKAVSAPYHLGETIKISLDPLYLPFYAFRTVIRMFVALFFSLVFTLIFGTIAAKSKKASRIIIPLIDILQSVPVLGFLQITVVFFIMLFPNSLLGPECACVFAIFVSQAWNMTLSLYQTLRTVPSDLKDAAAVFQLSAWQRYWRIEIPHSIPPLLWNMMMSMSGGWFFVVASEAIYVSNQSISLPGIGSYINTAILQGNIKAIFYSIFTMLLVILLYDQLIFRPLLYWAEKFKSTQDSAHEQGAPKTWVIVFFQKTRFFKQTGKWLDYLFEPILQMGSRKTPKILKISKLSKIVLQIFYLGFWVAFWAGAVIFLYYLGKFIIETLSFSEIKQVFVLGLITGIRILVLLVLASLVWVPVGVWIGRRPELTGVAQPIIQFLAAFPANLVFPLVVSVIVAFHLNVEIWTTPLMILGSQWYILFNVIAGTAALPKDLYQVTSNLGVKGWLWWKRFVFPGIFPYYLTGIITAAGGAWNASILAEYVIWKGITLKATGLGSYITEVTRLGSFPRTALGISVMCVYVILINRLVWQPLYDLAQERFQNDG